jgi:predicted nucleotidyltransferase
MRLSQNEVSLIRQTLAEVDPAGRVYLFGSRVDDSRRGGDIDLFLDASRKLDLNTTLRLQYRLISACDVHVDLLVKSPDEADEPIHQIARRGIAL